VTNQTRWSEFGIAFNKDKTDAQTFGYSAQESALTRSRWTFKQHMSISIKGGHDQFNFATSPNDGALEGRNQ
jgi:hypothetical protein